MATPARPAGWIAVILCAFAALVAAPAAAQQKVEADGPYEHRPAHAVYPLRVGGFARSDVYRYDAAGRDVSASYNLVTPEGRLLITVYIYPAPAVASAGGQSGGKAVARALLCNQEYDGVKAAISSQHDNAAPIEEGAALALPGTEASLSHRSIFRFRTRFDGEDQEIRSEAHLYCYVGGNWLVKYRVSAPAAVDTSGPVEAFIRAGPWPGRSALDTVARDTPGSRGGR